MIDEFLDKTVEQIEREFTARPELLSQPSTLVPLMWSWVRAAFEAHDPGRGEFFPMAFAEALATPTVRAVLRSRITGVIEGIERDYAENKVFLAVRDLARQAEDALPGSSLLAFADLCLPENAPASGGPLRVPSLQGFLDTAFTADSHLHRCMRPLGLLTRLDEGSPEDQAATTMRALQETVEKLHRSQLRVTIMLGRFAERRWPAFPADLGALADAAWRVAEGGHPALVDRRVIVLRNAQAHGHWTFVPASSTVHYWDRHTPVIAVPLSDLKRTLREIYFASGSSLFKAAVTQAARTIFFEAHFIDFLDELADGLQAEHQGRQQAGQNAWELWIATAFRDLRDFITVSRC